MVQLSGSYLMELIGMISSLGLTFNRHSSINCNELKTKGVKVVHWTRIRESKEPSGPKVVPLTPYNSCFNLKVMEGA